jgi:phage-related protein
MTVTASVLIQDVWTVSVIRVNGRSPAAEHIDGLAQPDRTKLFAFLRRVAAGGPPTNIQQNRRLDDAIWELKSGQSRLLEFRQGSHVIVITHGFRKQKQKLPRRELERA